MQNESWWTDVETFSYYPEGAIDVLAESKLTFTTHCSISSDFIERCHKLDLRCFPYVTFYVGNDDVQFGTTHSNAYEGVEFGKHKFYAIEDDKGIPSPRHSRLQDNPQLTAWVSS